MKRKPHEHVSPPSKRSRSAASARAIRRVVILGISPVQMLDVTGPAEVFSLANRLSGAHMPPYAVELVGMAGGRDIAGSSGLALHCPRGYRNVRGIVDTLLVAGGAGARTLRDPAVLRWLVKMAGRVRRMGSVCTGAFALAEAGLLDGKRATTHWAHTDELARRYPTIQVDANPIWVRDGSIYTSAGITAGMDLALALVADDLGHAAALRVARQLVLFLHRPGGQSQFSVALSHQTSDREPIRALAAWMAENLAADLSLAALAERAGMSMRNFCRVFEREQGTSPGRFVQRLRLEAARRELEQSGRGLKEIAAVCGFGGDEVLRLVFQREFKTTPGAYRKRFQANARQI